MVKCHSLSPSGKTGHKLPSTEPPFNGFGIHRWRTTQVVPLLGTNRSWSCGGRCVLVSLSLFSDVVGDSYTSEMREIRHQRRMWRSPICHEVFSSITSSWHVLLGRASVDLRYGNSSSLLGWYPQRFSSSPSIFRLTHRPHFVRIIPSP